MKAADGVTAEEVGANTDAAEGMEEEAASLWQRMKRHLLVWTVAGPTREVTHIFFESALLPMLLMIGVWNSRVRKTSAAYQFCPYTLVESVIISMNKYIQLMLLAIQVLLFWRFWPAQHDRFRVRTTACGGAHQQARSLLLPFLSAHTLFGIMP